MRNYAGITSIFRVWHDENDYYLLGWSEFNIFIANRLSRLAVNVIEDAYFGQVAE